MTSNQRGSCHDTACKHQYRIDCIHEMVNHFAKKRMVCQVNTTILAHTLNAATTSATTTPTTPYSPPPSCMEDIHASHTSSPNTNTLHGNAWSVPNFVPPTPCPIHTCNNFHTPEARARFLFNAAVVHPSARSPAHAPPRGRLSCVDDPRTHPWPTCANRAATPHTALARHTLLPILCMAMGATDSMMNVYKPPKRAHRWYVTDNTADHGRCMQARHTSTHTLHT